MIPFGSQRALGQDLATHLQNTQDNERMEVAQVRGAIARDLHGAFAEWEAQAHTLTRCTNYLYSLSINPDQRQGRLTKDQYLDYIERTESRLALSGQPRAIVFHIKKDKNGIPREHCHVVWSRIDAERGKARHIAFDHEKLMMVTREFARDHGLKLPDGYYRDKGQERAKKDRQLSYYEKKQEENGGLSKEQHRAQVTAAWHKRDTPRAFVRSLEDMGYILATGDRDYVLVDLYGNMNGLPKLIDDKKVRIKQVREFLGRDFPKTPCRPLMRRGRSPPPIAPRRSCSGPTSNGRRRKPIRRKGARPWSASSRSAARRWNKKATRWLSGSDRPDMNSRPGRRRCGQRFGKAICRKAIASGSTEPRISRRGWQHS